MTGFSLTGFDDVETENDIPDEVHSYTSRIKSNGIPSIFIRGNHKTRGEYSLHPWNYIERTDGRSCSAFSLGDTRFVFLDCGKDKPDNHRKYYDMNDYTRHRIDRTEFLKEELQSATFKGANKRILIHHIPVFGVRPDNFSPCSALRTPIPAKAPFNISLNGHTHRCPVIEKDKTGNNLPFIIGGGNREPNGTVMVLEKKEDKLTLEVINAAGKKLLEREL